MIRPNLDVIEQEAKMFEGRLSIDSIEILLSYVRELEAELEQAQAKIDAAQSRGLSFVKCEPLDERYEALLDGED